MLEKHTVTVDGCRLTYRRGGEGEPLLYLHGAGGSANAVPAMSELASRFDVILPDHPGFGESEEPEWLDTIHDLAYFYLDLIDHLKLDKVHLVGASLGGWVALEMAVRNDARLKSLTLVGPAGMYVKGSPPGDFFRWEPEELVRRSIVNQDLASQILSQEPTPEQKEIAIRNTFTTAKLAWEPRLHDPHLRKWLHRIKVPTHIIWGDSDQIIPPNYAEVLKSSVPGSQVTILDDCGHLPHVEHTGRYVELVSDFALSESIGGAAS